MTRIFSFCLLLLYLVSPQSEAQAQTPLKIVAHELTPLAWQEDGQAHGIVFDLVQAIQSELDVSYPTQFLPFKRGIYLTQNNPGYLFYPSLRTPERETKFKWVGPLLKCRGVLYQLANRPQVKSLEELYALRQIGVLLGSSSDDYLSSLGLKNLRRSHTRDDALRLLDLQRITANPLELYQADYYLLCSLSTPDEQIQQWQQALDKVLREQGEKIFARYQLPSPTVSHTRQDGASDR